MFRFALSPTGDMHIGDLQVALFNFLSAKQANDKLHIRIEDIDTEHTIAGKDQEILDLLTLFGIEFHEVSYQSQNLKFHQQLVTKLLMDKNAFSCFCTPQMLEADKEESKKAKKAYQYNDRCRYLSDEEVLNNEAPFRVRITRPDSDIVFDDAICGEVSFTKESIDSFVLLHTDKRATHDFACAIDDMLSDISMIICKEEELSHTPKQILIRQYLGYNKEIRYAHLPTIVNQEGNNGAENDNTFSLKWLLEEGFLPQAISNYLIMIGYKTPIEIFDVDEAINWFDIKSISKSTQIFDLDKLREINRAHIKRLDALELAKFIGYSSKDLGELAKIYTEENSTINEIKPKIDAIFAKKAPSEFQKEFAVLVKIAKEAPYFKAFDDFKSHLMQESGLKDEALLKPLRYLLTGMETGPNLGDIYPHIRNYLGEIIQ